jgi:hypothetical protein
LFELIVVAKEVRAKKILRLHVAGARRPTRTDGCKLAGVFEGGVAIEVGLGRRAEWREERDEQD